MARMPQEIPAQCIVVAAQVPFLPDGFSINKLHFVVLIPFVDAERVVRTSGVQLPLWPLELEILIAHRHFPTITSPNDLINFLTNLVEAGIVSDSPSRARV
jgi:hypothetical protein